MGVAITSCVLAYMTSRSCTRCSPRFQRVHDPREQRMQSCASAAGSMTSGGMVNAIPALMMLSPLAIPQDFATRCLWLIPWVTVISLLGVFLAVPAKRQMINIEQLPFPSGIAAATTMRTLHAEGRRGDPAGHRARCVGVDRRGDHLAARRGRQPAGHAAVPDPGGPDVGADPGVLRAREAPVVPPAEDRDRVGHRLDQARVLQGRPAGPEPGDACRSRARCCSSPPARSWDSARRGA